MTTPKLPPPPRSPQNRSGTSATLTGFETERPSSLWSSIVEASPLAVVVFRLPHLVATASNAAFHLLTGLRPAALIGSRWADLSIWEYPEAADRQLLGATLGRPCVSAPVEIRDLTGAQRSALATSSIMTVEMTDFLVIYLQDMTERRHAERALLWQYEQIDRQRREIAAILDAADEAMVLVSPDWRLANANRRFYELVGIPADRLLGLQVAQVRSRISSIFPGQALADLLEWNRDQTIDSPIHMRQLAPVERDFELTATDIAGADHTEHGRLFALRDITRQLEADRLKDEFIATVSHELRTPLTSIAGFVELLLDPAGEPLPAQAERFLGVIRRNVSQLIDQVNKLLDFSRLESDAVQITPTAIDIARTLREAGTLLMPQIAASGQTMTASIPSGLPAVMADAPRVNQILVNLLSNASKFTPAGGKIHITVRPEGDHVRIDIADTGVGLTENEQRLIFTRFYRVQTDASHQIPGCGLGLSIARILVERQGGHIWVASSPGAGSVFSFTLPTANSALQANQASAAA